MFCVESSVFLWVALIFFWGHIWTDTHFVFRCVNTRDTFIFFNFDVNDEMDVGLAWLRVYPPIQPVIVPRYTVHGLLYFKSIFLLLLQIR